MQELNYDQCCGDAVSWILEHGSSNKKAVQDFVALGEKGIFKERIWEDPYRVIADHHRAANEAAIPIEAFADRIGFFYDDFDEEERNVFASEIFSHLTAGTRPNAWDGYLCRLLHSYREEMAKVTIGQGRGVTECCTHCDFCREYAESASKINYAEGFEWDSFETEADIVRKGETA